MSVRDILKPINIVQWIDENKAFLQPPVCNKLIYGQGTEHQCSALIRFYTPFDMILVSNRITEVPLK
jgi:hypothetical protein